MHQSTHQPTHLRLVRRPLAFLVLALTLLATAVVGLTAATAASAAPDATGPGDRAAVAPTKVSVVRPVTAGGRAAPGWRVTKESGRVSCSDPSPAAVDAGIAACYPTAYGLTACFRSTDHTVLCVRDVSTRVLVRIRYSGTYPTDVQPLARPWPARTVLTDGRTCLMRTGGAWGSPRQHPDWVGYSSCTGHASTYGSGEGNGVDQHTSAWSVRLWRSDTDPDGRALVSRGVASASFVGVAAG